MIQGMPLLLDSLFGSKEFENISLAELEAMVTEFPSFNAGHYLLSKKLKDQQDDRFDSETRKTALYFNNPLWLQWLLQPEATTAATETEYQPGTTFQEEQQPQVAESDIPTDFTETTEPETTEPETTEPETTEPETTTEADDIMVAEIDEIPVADIQAFHPEPYHEPIHALLAVIPAYDMPATAIHPETADNREEAISGVPEQNFAAAVEQTIEQPITDVADPVPDGSTDETDETSDEAPLHMQAIAHFDTKKVESIVFEPYHVIDYFASQGIKLVIEDNPKDSFSKQLKSFTDWLRVMKRIPDTPISEEQQDREAEQIRHFAAHSIEGKDVLTETMAEVLAKQGMFANAAALYRKLSLLYPDKSAYFAARIEQLKPQSP